tara:strand:+ start:161 stop:286 length:126 start_codon:yes stop_codon:yes gene_type:complete
MTLEKRSSAKSAQKLTDSEEHQVALEIQSALAEGLSVLHWR